MPKSGHMANQHARPARAAVVALLTGPAAKRHADLQQHLLQLRQRRRGRGARDQRAPLTPPEDHAGSSGVERRVGPRPTSSRASTPWHGRATSGPTRSADQGPPRCMSGHADGRAVWRAVAWLVLALAAPAGRRPTRRVRKIVSGTCFLCPAPTASRPPNCSCAWPAGTGEYIAKQLANFAGKRKSTAMAEMASKSHPTRWWRWASTSISHAGTLDADLAGVAHIYLHGNRYSGAAGPARVVTGPDAHGTAALPRLVSGQFALTPNASSRSSAPASGPTTTR